jgi:transcriptional regulator with PAS, ATPase and Fis domain
MLSHSEGQSHVLVGQSARIRQVVKLVERVGKGRWPALILGETGTGKEVVARSIHSANPLGPFVTIDCSSLVGPLMESELFGHAKGSFTGAHVQKIGLLEVANGGTAFLDEIGELPLDLQAKLLRVLQEKEFRPVGSLQTRRSDFRIVAATNRNLAAEVEKGTFRRDLYYRLNVITVRVAPLRERKDDIPSLLTHFLEKYGDGHTITAEVLEAMIAYDWPGNVRELENSIQHMVAVNSGPLLHTHDLPSSIQNHLLIRRADARVMIATAAVVHGSTHSNEVPVKPPGVATAPPRGNHPVMPLSEVEKRAILQALEYTQGDRAVAAHLLGIGRTTLYRKLKEYDLMVGPVGFEPTTNGL